MLTENQEASPRTSNPRSTRVVRFASEHVERFLGPISIVRLDVAYPNAL